MDDDCFSEEPHVPTYNAEFDIPDAFPSVLRDNRMAT